MFDFSSSCELRKLKSNPLSVEWTACPATQDFKLKIKRENGKSSKFVYTLKEGVSLPYKPAIEGSHLKNGNLDTNLSILRSQYCLLQIF